MKKIYQFTPEEIRAIDQEMARYREENSVAVHYYEDWPDCPCGWSGRGTGPDGRFVRGDCCPMCGQA